jgi:hypothetical protein
MAGQEDMRLRIGAGRRVQSGQESLVSPLHPAIVPQHKQFFFFWIEHG